jgi:hypothetical protein
MRSVNVMEEERMNRQRVGHNPGREGGDLCEVPGDLGEVVAPSGASARID